jgi:hypothetical protein
MVKCKVMAALTFAKNVNERKVEMSLRNETMIILRRYHE